MAKTRGDIVGKRLKSQLDDALASVGDKRRTIDSIKRELDRVITSPVVRKAIIGVDAVGGITDGMKDSYESPIRGPLIMDFSTGPGDENAYYITAFLGDDKIELSSGRNTLTPEDPTFLAEQLFERGFGPEHVVEKICDNLRVRKDHIREFAAFLETEYEGE